MMAICKQGWLSMFKQLFIFLTLLFTFILTSLPSQVKAQEEDEIEVRDGDVLNQSLENDEELEAQQDSSDDVIIDENSTEDLRVRSPAIIREDLEELEEVERQSLMNASLNAPTITSQKEAEAIKNAPGRSPNSMAQESLYDQRQLDALIRITERARLTTTR